MNEFITSTAIDDIDIKVHINMFNTLLAFIFILWSPHLR